MFSSINLQISEKLKEKDVAQSENVFAIKFVLLILETQHLYVGYIYVDVYFYKQNSNRISKNIFFNCTCTYSYENFPADQNELCPYAVSTKSFLRFIGRL